MNRPRRWIGTVALVAMISASTLGLGGCLGDFALTHKILKWNDGVGGGGVVAQLVFWALVIIPVYELALLGDTVIFNVLEYWTGSNPMALGPDARHEVLADGSVRVEHEGRVWVLAPTAQGQVSVQLDGQEVALVSLDDQGAATVMNLLDGRLAHLSSAELDVLRANLPTPTGEPAAP